LTTEMSKIDVRRNIYVIGGLHWKTSVGKKALIRRFMTDEFSDDTYRRLHTHGGFFDSAFSIGFNSFSHTMKIDGRDVCFSLHFPILFDFVDCIKQVHNLTFCSLPYSYSYMIVFDVTNEDSFDQARSYYNEIKQYNQEHGIDVPVLLVGNKIDLFRERVINKLTATRFCEEVGIPYIETSAKTSEGVTEAFTLLAKMELTTAPKGIREPGNNNNNGITTTPKTATPSLPPFCFLMVVSVLAMAGLLFLLLI